MTPKWWWWRAGSVCESEECVCVHLTKANECVQKRASLVTQMVKNLPATQETWVQSLGWEDFLEKGMATHSSVLAWRISWTEEPDEFLSLIFHLFFLILFTYFCSYCYYFFFSIFITLLQKGFVCFSFFLYFNFIYFFQLLLVFIFFFF